MRTTINHCDSEIGAVKRLLALLLLWLSVNQEAAAQNFWEQAGPPLGSEVGALAIKSNGVIFAGTNGGGVFRSTNNGEIWERASNGLSNTVVTALVINESNGYIFAGTDDDVFFSTDDGNNWTSTQQLKDINPFILALTINANGDLIAGTQGGKVFLSRNNSGTWDDISTGLPSGDIYFIVINSRGDIFVGISGKGVFRSENNGASWKAVNAGLENPVAQGNSFYSSAINCGDYIFVGTQGNGVYRSTNHGDNWAPFNSGLTDLTDRALIINSSQHIFVGTFGGGVFISTDNGKNWNVRSSGLDTHTVVLALAINSSGFLFAGTGASDGRVFRSRESTTPSSYPSSLSLSTTINFPTRAKSTDYVASDYRIVGLPGVSDQLITDFLSLTGTQNEDWQVYRDNGDPSSDPNKYLVAFNGSSDFKFSVGRAFWVLQKGPLNISNPAVPSVPPNATNDIELPLHTGWNLITNPYTDCVEWSRIQAVNNITEPIYEYDGSFATATSLKPYAGYYFLNATNLPMLKIPVSLYFSSSSTSANTDPTKWRVNIALYSGEFSDKLTSFGIASSANSGLDRFDFHKPRNFGNMPTVSFQRPAWDENFSTFATDIRPEFETSESWEFEVNAPQHEAAQLAFSGIGKVPNPFEVFLIDERQARAVNLRADSLYRFTPATEISKFRVLVGKREAVQEQLSAVPPKAFALGPNFPNPFLKAAPSSTAGGRLLVTTIPVEIPFKSEVTLKIYNLLGAEVKTLHAGALEAGRHWLNWDGRNEAGKNVAAGIYLYRLTTSTGVRLVGKMILTR